MMQRKHYDVIFLDHMMPELDGIETMKISHTLKNNKCSDTPIIALTANAIVGVREMYINEGFDDYLSKPVNGMQLEDMLRKYLPEEKQQITENNDEVEEEKPCKNGDSHKKYYFLHSILQSHQRLYSQYVTKKYKHFEQNLR